MLLPPIRCLDIVRQNRATGETEVHAVPPGWLLVGHTHLQFRRDMFGRVIVNPGSLGQPKTAAPQACFATWEDGSIQFHFVPYPYQATIEKIRQLQIPKQTEDYLITTLETGLPFKPQTSNAD